MSCSFVILPLSKVSILTQMSKNFMNKNTTKTIKNQKKQKSKETNFDFKKPLVFFHPCSLCSLSKTLLIPLPKAKLKLKWSKTVWKNEIMNEFCKQVQTVSVTIPTIMSFYHNPTLPCTQYGNTPAYFHYCKYFLPCKYKKCTVIRL